MKYIFFLLIGIVLLQINACISPKSTKPTFKEVTLSYDPASSFDEKLSDAMLNAERIMVTFPKPSEKKQLPNKVVAWLGVVEDAEGTVYSEPLILKGIEEDKDKDIAAILSSIVAIVQLYPKIAEWVQEKRTEQLYAPAKNYHAALCYKRPTEDERRNDAEPLHRKVVFIRKQDNASIPHSCYY
jgi:hypothetical protein